MSELSLLNMDPGVRLIISFTRACRVDGGTMVKTKLCNVMSTKVDGEMVNTKPKQERSKMLL